MALRHDWVKSILGVDPDRLLLETAIGESMTPTIRDGNMLLIDTTDQTFRNFGIYVLEINGQRLVKRVQRKHDGSLVLISDNSAYQPDFVERQRPARSRSSAASYGPAASCEGFEPTIQNLKRAWVDKR